MDRRLEILIVEDSRTQAMRLRHILESAGYAVSGATNGVEALRMLATRRPDMVISDVMMPEMDGFALCEAVKADPGLENVPVILVTTLSDPTDVVHALQSGADNFLTKPYDDDALLSRIEYTVRNLELRSSGDGCGMVDVLFGGVRYRLDSSKIRMVDLLLSTYESAIRKNRELQEANRQLKDALSSIRVLEANYLRLLETNRDAILVLDSVREIRYANPAALEMLGPSKSDLPRQAANLPTRAGERRELELRLASGRTLTVDARVSETDWDGAPMSLVVLRDISDSVRMRRELQQLSLTDELTGLYNRRGFALLAERGIAEAAASDRSLYLVFVDLDGMKTINDRLGHIEGDRALVDVAGILRSTYGSAIAIARMGGDEFAAIGWASDAPDPPAAPGGEAAIEGRLRDAVAVFNAGGERSYPIALSMGALVFPPGTGNTVERILQVADARMYQDKRSRNGGRI